MDIRQKNNDLLQPATAGFVARYTHKLDNKKRLIIPVGWRELVGRPPSLYVLPGLKKDICIYLYPARTILPRLQKFNDIPLSDHKARAYARALASQSDMVTWDNLGRIRIRDELLNYARLDNEVVMNSSFDHFEIWNPGEWKRVLAKEPISIDDAVNYFKF